ncbi:hypothetical protein OUZ56_009579 [Daphnia magna]|uniref:Uncharacterized protein n=1 Tax=Daphnia magna TaxID=35525 RepID=A0ABR0AGD3_9CRUS|nr:hypothetical protein OUZ56_009579 [Daphnia magna]
MAEDPEYEVEEIVDRGKKKPFPGLEQCPFSCACTAMKKDYSVSDTDNQWIPAKLTNCRTLIREFNKKKIMNNVLTPPQSNSDGIVELFEDVGGGVADRRGGLGVDGGVNGGVDGFRVDGGVFGGLGCLGEDVGVGGDGGKMYEEEEEQHISVHDCHLKGYFSNECPKRLV